MDNSRIARENAEVAQTGTSAPHRSEKGTAGIIIAAENTARQEKTERLKAARLARVESEVAEAPKAASKAKRRATASKTAKAKTVKKSASPVRKKKAAV
ncbi:hypothetical protein [Fulvimarina sp. MAC3]|uniref:hypothetical protein n=1 Tax=Fulvimarina sp. MAC3 TaxID=3148887 RepID=UPI0031FDEBF4